VSWRIVAVAAVSVFVLAACGGGNGDGDGGGGAAAAGDDAAAVDSVAVSLVDNEFDPSSVTVASGGAVDVSNDGEALHNFSVEGEDVDVDVKPGESTSVDLSSLEPGSYELLCKLHESAGMTGTLEVEG
jgi:plastocyanin